MSHDPIPYTAVLTDLEVRRNLLNSRVSNLDSAIGAISALLEDGAVRPVGATPKPVLPVASETSSLNPPIAEASCAAAAPALPGERRKKTAALNVYVNRHPDWSRGMSKAKVVARKQNGVRCPKCSSIDTRQSATRTLSDYFMFLFDYTNARCRNCNARFRVWRPQTGRMFQPELPPGEKVAS